MKPTFLRIRRIALAVALVAAAGCTVAHDWTSPRADAAPRARLSPDPFPGPAWSSLSWPGPAAGAPAVPAARDCKRLPQLVDLAGPMPPQQARHKYRDSLPLGERSEAARLADALERRPAEAAASKSADASGRKSAEAVPPPPAPVAAPAVAMPTPEAADRTAAAPALMPPRTPPARPASEPVTAGVIDDNTDFGEYLAYRQRSAGRVNMRERDIRERYRLTVHDAAGRPVPDALVSVHGTQPWPLWARTDAGGQVWLHPRAAGVTDPTLTLRVTKPSADGELHGSALLRRGQRDALQVRLDGVLPAEPARLDIAFLIDATGSMADEIDKLKRSMRAVAEQIAALPSRPDVCWSLVAYRDRGDEFFVRYADFTDDLAAFQGVLGGLHAAAGGDYPEAMNEALHTAVHRLSWRGDGATRLVVLVADAPPHLDYGQPWYDDDMGAALARGIKLFGIAASGLDASGAYIQRQIAQYTGGRFVFLTYEQAHNPASGPGRETAHDVGNYSVETLDKLIVRLVREELARRP